MHSVKNINPWQALILACLLLAPGSPVWAQAHKPVMISDRLYWDGAEGNLGLHLSGKFRSQAIMAETFNLQSVIGRFNSKTWILSDILVTLDCNANGWCADWQVSGPKPLLLEYLKTLESRYRDKSVLYDFDYGFILFKPTAYFETEAGISKNQALEIAEKVCRREGWPWEKVHIQDQDEFYEVTTNWGALGNNAFIRIAKRDGKVLEQHRTGP